MSLLRGLFALFVFVAVVFSHPAKAQDPYEQGAEALVSVLLEKADPEMVFAPSFLSAVPKQQVLEIARQLRAQNGAVLKVERITKVSSTSGSVDFGYEKSIVSMTMSIDPTPPNKVIGLLITGVKARNDSVSALTSDFKALPGRAGVLVTRLDAVPAVQPLLSINAKDRFAVGSSFKLWVLGEAARAVAAKERKWSDVIVLGPPSLPSGIVQKWPLGSPMTLHSLATLMISISDNSTTDTLMRNLGRTRIDAMVGKMGHSSPTSTLPVLTTVEAFALKSQSNFALKRRYVFAAPVEKLGLLQANAQQLTVASVRAEDIMPKPRDINSIEWFASPIDMTATLDWLRKFGGKDALAIMAVNPGIAEGDAARFAYVGYKGGSETGVISMNLLLRSKSGAWYAVTASWNDESAEVDELRFVALVSRAVALVP